MEQMDELYRLELKVRDLMGRLDKLFKVFTENYKNDLSAEVSSVRVYLYTRWECLSKCLWYVGSARKEYLHFGETGFYHQNAKLAKSEFKQYLEETENERGKALLEKYLSDIDTSDLTIL